jgi:hypothetical protein
MAQAVYISTDLVNGPVRAAALGNLPFFNAAGWAFTPPCVVIQGGVPLTVSTISDSPTQTTAVAITAALAPLNAQELTALVTANNNNAILQTNLNSRLATIEAWIAANPSGAILTAAQTLILARMMAGLTRVALAETSTLGGG